MASFELERTIDAPAELVWAALDDFGGIAAWNTGIRDSYIVAGNATGVGATRRCEFGRKGRLEERIDRYEAGRHLGLTFDEIPLPVHGARVDFRIARVTDDQTRITVDYHFHPRGLWKVDTPLFSLVLKRAMRHVLRDLARHVEHQARAATRRPTVVAQV